MLYIAFIIPWETKRNVLNVSFPFRFFIFKINKNSPNWPKGSYLLDIYKNPSTRAILWANIQGEIERKNTNLTLYLIWYIKDLFLLAKY